MNTLVIFRRPEIWILFFVVVALLVFAFRPEPGPAPVTVTQEPAALALPERSSEPIPEELAVNPGSAETGLVVESVKVEGDENKEGRLVEVTLSGRSATEEEAPVTEKTLTARTDAGDPVNHFFEPFREEQALFPEEDSLVTVRLWLEKPAEFIWLDFQGRTVKTELPR